MRTNKSFQDVLTMVQNSKTIADNCEVKTYKFANYSSVKITCNRTDKTWNIERKADTKLVIKEVVNHILPMLELEVNNSNKELDKKIEKLNKKIEFDKATDETNKLVEILNSDEKYQNVIGKMLRNPFTDTIEPAMTFITVGVEHIAFDPTELANEIRLADKEYKSVTEDIDKRMLGIEDWEAELLRATEWANREIKCKFDAVSVWANKEIVSRIEAIKKFDQDIKNSLEQAIMDSRTFEESQLDNSYELEVITYETKGATMTSIHLDDLYLGAYKIDLNNINNSSAKIVSSIYECYNNEKPYFSKIQLQGFICYKIKANLKRLEQIKKI